MSEGRFQPVVPDFVTGQTNRLKAGTMTQRAYDGRAQNQKRTADEKGFDA